MKHKNRTLKELKHLVEWSKSALLLQGWHIQVKWATKQDLKNFKSRVKTEKVYLGAKHFYAAVWQDAHYRYARIIFDKRMIKNICNEELAQVVFHELFHIHVGRTLRKQRTLPLASEEVLVERLASVASVFALAIESLQNEVVSLRQKLQEALE